MNIPRMEITLSRPNMQVLQVENKNNKIAPTTNPIHGCPKWMKRGVAINTKIIG
jgi:hypothetical protein